ncbi:hypothetical protein K503DRAFT_769909 [Rhizopogon vinicolor AM-OR11-026]|uniref:Uncharacterized protein n=1 Tax=Rhizopogon vinicolor AM-OR11-026 TaxID=1314800 RepID=A0A1B7N2A4_9AGAM|nr:hypothetical protein K503DRAFT_769909 [Rhizopogon vinicolor AM-OR11-026]
MDRPPVTFRGLFAALRHCPHLEYPQVYINAVNVDIDPEAESFRYTYLAELDVCSARIRNIDAVTRIVYSMLPRIAHVGPDRIRLLGWKEVNELKSWRCGES